MSAVTIYGQATADISLGSAITGTGAQTAYSVSGYNGAQMVELIAVGTSGGHTMTMTVEGSWDNSHFYTVGYARVDGQTTLTRSVAGFTLTPGNGTSTAILQLFDVYRYIRMNISNNTLGTGLTGTVHLIPS